MSVSTLERVVSLHDYAGEHSAGQPLAETDIALSGLAEISVRRHAVPEEGSELPYGRLIQQDKLFEADIDVRGPYVYVNDPSKLTTVIYSTKPLPASEQLRDEATNRKTWLMHYMRVVEYKMVRKEPSALALASAPSEYGNIAA